MGGASLGSPYRVRLELFKRSCNGYMVEGHLKVLVRFPPTHISHVWAITAGIISVAGPVTMSAILVLIY